MVGSKVAEGYVEFGSRLQGFRKGLAEVKKGLGNFARQGAKLAAGFTIAAGGAGVGLLKLASDAEEGNSKFQAVFKDQSKAAEEFVTGFAKDVGRSKNEMKGFVAALGDTFNPLGFAVEDSRLLAQEVTKLGVDLASFNNLSDAEALEALQSALIGNHETVRKFGVIITEATLSQELMKLGVEGGTKAATEQQKALARLSIIQASTGDAQGDAIKTADGLANSWKGLVGGLKDLGADLGSKLIEPAKEIVQLFKEWVAAGQVTAESMGSFGGFGSLFTDIKEWINAIVSAFINWDLIAKDLGISMAEFGMNAWERMKTFFSNIGEALQWMFKNWKNIFSTIADFVLTVLINLGSNIRTFFAKIWEGIKSGSMPEFSADDFKSMTDGFRASVDAPEFKKAIVHSLKDQHDDVDKEWQKRMDKVKERTTAAVKEGTEEGAKKADTINLAEKVKELGGKEEKKKKSKSSGGFKDLTQAWIEANEKLFGKKDPNKEILKESKEQTKVAKKNESHLKQLVKSKGVAVATP